MERRQFLKTGAAAGLIGSTKLLAGADKERIEHDREAKTGQGRRAAFDYWLCRNVVMDKAFHLPPMVFPVTS